MKKAFTLVELIVVVGIICILAAILIASFGGGTESARNALCLPLPDVFSFASDQLDNLASNKYIAELPAELNHGLCPLNIMLSALIPIAIVRLLICRRKCSTECSSRRAAL